MSHKTCGSLDDKRQQEQTYLFQDAHKTWNEILVWLWVPLDGFLECTQRCAHD